MAGTGSDEFDALIRLLRATSAEAVPAAENAAAIVYRDAAVHAAAGHSKSGQLASSIKIIEGRPQKGVLAGEIRNRLFVGPDKKKGFYGYFLEKGWTATGPKRRGRKATMTTHSQRGVAGGHKVHARPWFEPSQRAADSRAEQAAEAAFNSKLEQLNNRG